MVAANDEPGLKPTPDPTVLTTEQLLREVETLSDLVDAKIAGVYKYFDTKVDGMNAVRSEHFESINTQFQLVERQRVEQKKDTKDAVDAALAAAKEAVKEQTTASGLSIAKSETATSEQLKQLTQTFTTAIQGVDRSIGDLKERVGKIESIKQGANEYRGDRRDGTAVTLAIMGAVISALILVLGIYAAFHK